MTNFKKFKRFDESANEGKWFEVVDEFGNEYGSFKLGLIDRSAPSWRVKTERWHRLNGNRNFKNREAELLVDCALFDWKMLDADDKPIKYDTKVAKEYLSDLENSYVLESLYTQGSNPKNFKDEDEPEKN